MVPAVVLVLALALLGAACSSTVEDPGPPDPDALDWSDGSIDLDGVDLAVGSKETAEQRVLGWLAAEALRSSGADVQAEIDLGGTGANREAMLAGLIDLYWEYTGVGWTSVLQRSDPATDPGALYEDVRERDLEENDVVWLPPADTSRGWGFVADPSVATAEALVGVADVARVLDEDDEAVVCVAEGSEFPTDADGLGRFEEATGTEVGEERLVAVPTDDLYPAVAAGLCPVAAVELGDPLLAGTGLTVLERDDVFVPQQPSVTVRGDVLADADGAEEVLEAVSAELGAAELRELAAAVVVDGAEPREVARAWLVEQGLAREPG